MSDFVQQNIHRVEGVINSTLGSTLMKKFEKEVLDGFCRGKFLRSKFGLKLYEYTSEEIPDIFYNCAAVVEMIHSASLIHDDIIDGSDIRRGGLTLWKNKGASSAVIVGDYLFCTAMELLSTIGDEETGKVFSTKIKEMCEGEFEQEFINKGKNLGLRECREINRKKTGALFSMIGYVSAGEDRETSEALARAGYMTGIAYQFIDDLIDRFGDESRIGKTLGTDRKKNKPTAVKCFEGKESELIDEIENTIAEAEEILEQWPGKQKGYKEYIESCFRPYIAELSRNIQSSVTEKIA